MKKKSVSLLLALTLVFSLLPTALAAEGEAVTPTPPEWINEEDYLIFPGDEVYEPENWAKVEAMREEARNGALLVIDGSQNWAEGSPGMCYETALVRIKYGLNAGIETDPKKGRNAFYSAGRAFSAAQDDYWGGNGKPYDELYYRLNLERYRAYAVYRATYVSDWKQSLTDTLVALNMTLDDFFAGQYMSLMEPGTREIITADMQRIEILLDGYKLTLDVPPEVKNQRTMVPIRRLAELIGATVEWIQDTQQIVMTRAGVTVTMTLNSTTATIDDQTVEMDVAPYATNERTLLPARYVAEFFGQKVDWDGARWQVLITEDKSVAGDSNLEAWALAMGALLNYSNNPWEAYLFGGNSRFGTNPVGSEVSSRSETTGPDFGRQILSESWLITDRNSLLTTIDTLTAGNDAWDWCRVSHLAQWGYLAGYVTYPEALELVESSAKKVCAAYSSWEEVYEVYITGYCRWLGQDTADVWNTERGQLYQSILANPHMAPILDDTLFETGVIPLP